MSELQNQNQTRFDVSPSPSLASAVEELTRIGLGWARHGLRLGQSALEASAETLEGTARVLARVARSLDRPE
jgi:hypothetical protein